jgi:exodeoxyribonuclease V alpha subunit
MTGARAAAEPGNRQAPATSSRPGATTTTSTWPTATPGRSPTCTATVRSPSPARKGAPGAARRLCARACRTRLRHHPRGAQGSTATGSHLLLGEHTTASSAYVGMTRGRERNTVHLVAENLDAAREQWVAAYARNRADLGSRHAAERAAREAAGYAPARPLHRVLSDLREAWSDQADRQRELQRATALRERIAEVIALRAYRDRDLAVLDTREQLGPRQNKRAPRPTAPQPPSTGTPNRSATSCCISGTNSSSRPATPPRVVLAGPGRLRHRLVNSDNRPAHGRLNARSEPRANASATFPPGSGFTTCGTTSPACSSPTASTSRRCRPVCGMRARRPRSTSTGTCGRTRTRRPV